MTRAINSAVAMAVFAAIAASAIASPVITSQAPEGSTMWFSDKYATAYYQIDKANSELVATILPGPSGGNSVEVRRKLRFNDSEAITLKGHGANAVAATLIVKHSGADILSRVRTEEIASSNTN